MSQLPEEIKKMIQRDARDMCRIEIKPDVVISHSEYSVGALMIYHECAMKYTRLMGEFAEWAASGYDYSYDKVTWWDASGRRDAVYTTSELLTLFFKSKGMIK